MLDILTPEGALSFIIYRVSLICKSVMRDGLSLRLIRVKKNNKPKKNHFFRLFCKTFVIGHKMQSLIKKSM